MYACTHCSEKVFSWRDKRRAHIMQPACCPRCGRHSALAVADRSGAQIAFVLVLFAGGVTALLQHTLWWWLLFVLLALGAYRWCIHRAALLPASLKERDAGRTASWVSALFVLLGMFLR